MIVYSLACGKGHAFEGWFKDSAAFDAQAADGKLVCPMCNSRKVVKAPMAPAVSGTKSKGAPSPGELAKMRQFMTGLRKYVEENAEMSAPNSPRKPARSTMAKPKSVRSMARPHSRKPRN